MKVYILTVQHDEQISPKVVNVFDKPKTARKWLDNLWKSSSKNKWVKNLQDGSRSHRKGKLTYTLIEHKLVTAKKNEKD